MRLPARFGGMSFDDPVVDSGCKHADSIECTANLSQQILVNGTGVMQSIELESEKKVTVWQRHAASLKVKANDLQRHIPEAQKRAMAQVCEKGGSSTLTTIPVAEHGFSFDVKAGFHDHIHFRYCWPLDNLPYICPCGERYTVDHAQMC